MPIPNNLIAPLLEGCSSPESILGESGLLKQLTKRIAERVHVSDDSDHSFRSNPITHFGLIRSPISVLSDHF